MKKFLIFTGIFMALIFCVLIILPFVIDINDIVAKQIPGIEKKIHRKVTIGDVKLTIITGLGAEINNVTISNHPDFRQQNFVSIDRLKATVQLLPLLKKEVLISSIAIDKPTILIERDAQGKFNFSDMTASKEPAQASPKEPDKEKASTDPLAALKNIEISKISITDGNFKFFDAKEVQTPNEFSLDQFNLSMKAVSLSRKIMIDLSTDVYASPKAGHVAMSGHVGPIGTRPEPENIPVDLSLSIDGVNLPHLAQYLKGMKITSGSIDARTVLKGSLKDKMEFRLDIDWDKLDMTMGDDSKKDAAPQQIAVNGSWHIEADVSGTPKSPVASGKISLDESSIRYGQLFDKPAATPLNLDFNVAVKGDRQDIKKITARIGALEASVSGQVDKGPVLDLTVQTNRFSAEKLIELSPKTASGLPKDLKLPDTVQLSASVAGAVEDLNFKTDLDITDGKVAFGEVFQKDAGTPLSVNLSGRLKKDALRVDNLKFILSKMVLTAAADIQHFADPVIDGKAEIAPTPLNALAPILPKLKAYELDGTLALSDVRFKGKISELKELKGVSGSLTLKNGSATSAELDKKIEKIQASVNVADNAIQIRNTSVQIGPSDLNLNATVRNPMKPDITFNLASNYLDVAALMPPKKDKPKAEKKETAPDESDSKAGTPEKKKAPDLKVYGKASIKKCKYDKLMLENVLAEIQYVDAVATLKSLSFDTFGGNIAAGAKVNLADMQSLRWSADLSTKNISANDTLSQFTSIKDTLYGNFNSKLSVQGKGTDWPAISKTIAGSGFADVVNGKLANVNLLDAVGQSLLKFQGLGLVAQAVAPEAQTQVKETAFQDLSGKFNIRDGKILLDGITMASKDLKLSGGGNIGLDKSLDLNTTLVFSKSTSERLQKDKTLKYLLNKDQLLEIPCAIKGDVTSPRIAVDGDTLNRLLQNAATKAATEQIQKHLDDKVGKGVGKEVDKVLKNIFK
ncbi:MAG: AsmA family protein [Desulfobacterales bacterium]